MEAKHLIDIHIHMLPFPDGKGDILNSTPLRRFFIKKTEAADAAGAKAAYLKKLVCAIENSRYVSRGVLLAVDGVYAGSGELDAGNTRFMVANDSVLSAVEGYPALLAGCSVNPARRDAVEELSRCKEKGMVLVKVIPNAQNFDPSERRFIPFYRKMAELKMPLLCHSGYEFALTSKGQALGNPSLLRTALEEGVDVVAAHASSTGLVFYERYISTVKELVKAYPNFFLDVSALTFPTRVGMLLRIRNSPEIKERLLFGSDYPVPSIYFPFKFLVGRREYMDIKGEGNYFDRLVCIFRALGMDFSPVLQERLIPLSNG
ncbi:MAG: amidohydrolase family protein [Deltaproteobacteria bacterium]|nr:amidohydrolase family protein [Deltaproteobacteria bacterium]